MVAVSITEQVELKNTRELGCFMLELYHHGSSVCAAKVRYALGEKGIDDVKMH